MAFERIEKNKFMGRGKLDENEVYVGSSGFSFNHSLVKDIEYLEVYLDRDGDRIGFMVGNKLTGFKIQTSNPKKKDSNMRISLGKGVMGNISSGVFASEKEDGMIIIKEIEFVK